MSSLVGPLAEGKPARGCELMRSPPPVSYPDETLTDITERFAASGVGRLPVVSRDDRAALLGVVSHSDVLATYHRAVPKRLARPQNLWRPRGVCP
jgi:CBS domain-containing protein